MNIIVGHMLNTDDVSLPELQHLLNLYLVFYKGHRLLLFLFLFQCFLIYFLTQVPVFVYICVSVCGTVVVRSQVVVLALRGSVAGETRCPYQEAG